jgi:CheY-like chemotaxis protein
MPHKLLLADDSVTIQRVIELTFADEDIEVIAVGDGKLAIDRVRTERPDIVLADVGMPELDGYQVSTFVKSTPAFAHIPVLLLTGAFEPIDESRARAAGCDGVLVKPFEPQLVIHRVKDLITGSRRPATPAAVFTSTPSESPASPQPVKPQGSVDEYFDRLDAAFASRESQPAAGRPATLAEELSDWHPESLETSPPSRPGPQASRSTPAEAAPALPSAARSEVTLAEAFASLLAAEQGRVQPVAAPVSPVNDAALVEQITNRVIERISSGAVQETVVRVAERLVRDEIDRIKSHAR